MLTTASPNVGRKVEAKENAADGGEATQCTAFGKALYDLTHSEKVMNDLTCGRRVGFYKLRGEIGSGNFSQVRLGIHDLTKGEILETFPLLQLNSISDGEAGHADADCYVVLTMGVS